MKNINKKNGIFLSILIIAFTSSYFVSSIITNGYNISISNLEEYTEEAYLQDMKSDNCFIGFNKKGDSQFDCSKFK